MRKFVLSVLALFVCVGLTIAAQVHFVKYDEDKKELTVKEDDKEKTYKITDKTTFKAGDKDVAAEKAAGRLKKMKADAKFDITVDGDKVTEVKFPGKKN
jgi:biopolymer transport protein ExbD